MGWRRTAAIAGAAALVTLGGGWLGANEVLDGDVTITDAAGSPQAEVDGFARAFQQYSAAGIRNERGFLAIDATGEPGQAAATFWDNDGQQDQGTEWHLPIDVANTEDDRIEVATAPPGSSWVSRAGTVIDDTLEFGIVPSGQDLDYIQHGAMKAPISGRIVGELAERALTPVQNGETPVVSDVLGFRGHLVDHGQVQQPALDAIQDASAAFDGKPACVLADTAFTGSTFICGQAGSNDVTFTDAAGNLVDPATLED